MAKIPIKAQVPEPLADYKPEGVPMLKAPPHGPALPASVLWPKGVSANPGGVPKGKRLSTWLAEFQAMPRSDWPSAEEAAELPAAAEIALAQLRRAMDQSEGLPAAMWAADRVEGGVDRTVHLTHKQEPTMSPDEAAKIIKASEDARKLDSF